MHMLQENDVSDPAIFAILESRLELLKVRRDLVELLELLEKGEVDGDQEVVRKTLKEANETLGANGNVLDIGLLVKFGN